MPHDNPWTIAQNVNIVVRGHCPGPDLAELPGKMSAILDSTNHNLLHPLSTPRDKSMYSPNPMCSYWAFFLKSILIKLQAAAAAFASHDPATPADNTSIRSLNRGACVMLCLGIFEIPDLQYLVKAN